MASETAAAEGRSLQSKDFTITWTDDWDSKNNCVKHETSIGSGV
jgi:hypothetical protein